VVLEGELLRFGWEIKVNKNENVGISNDNARRRKTRTAERPKVFPQAS